MKKRVLSILLALVMVLSILPVSGVFAATQSIKIGDWTYEVQDAYHDTMGAAYGSEGTSQWMKILTKNEALEEEKLVYDGTDKVNAFYLAKHDGSGYNTTTGQFGGKDIIDDFKIKLATSNDLEDKNLFIADPGDAGNHVVLFELTDNEGKSIHGWKEFTIEPANLNEIGDEESDRYELSGDFESFYYGVFDPEEDFDLNIKDTVAGNDLVQFYKNIVIDEKYAENSVGTNSVETNSVDYAITDDYAVFIVGSELEDPAPNGDEYSDLDKYDCFKYDVEYTEDNPAHYIVMGLEEFEKLVNATSGENSLLDIIDSNYQGYYVGEFTVEKPVVTFESNGGSEVAAQEVVGGTAAVKPEDPTKDGYTFAGWYADEELTQAYDFATLVTEDITLYAKWENNPKTGIAGSYTTLIIAGGLLVLAAAAVVVLRKRSTQK